MIENVLEGRVVYCDTCGAIGPYQEMIPYEYGKLFKSHNIYRHKGCGGKLFCYLKPDEPGISKFGHIREGEWEALSPDERQFHIQYAKTLIGKATKDLEESNQRIANMSWDELRTGMKEVKNFQKYNNPNLTCPVCGSHVVKKLTTADRAVSVAAWGLASGKIGKQYECKDCGHKW